ncbi:MAG: hypothetical protein ACFFAK_16335, partial [Promethearchaeota archaeon]
ITLKLENGKTFIYVNGKRFLQCIRLILNIPKKDTQLYDEIESIDEAADLYNKRLSQNRIVTGPMARPVLDQTHDITPEEEFWGHCSNIQAWVENEYDTRILKSNISFPLLRELTQAGDPLARKVFKDEIALRLESGYPSVVQYLINQGYIKYLTPFEFKTVIDTTKLIENISREPRTLKKALNIPAISGRSFLEDIHLKDPLKIRQSLIRDTVQTSDILSERKKVLEKRKRLKKAYYNDILKLIEAKEYEKAIVECEDVVNRLIKNKKYKLAGISLVILTLMLLKQNRVNEINKKLEDMEKNLYNFSETYASMLIHYILDINKRQKKELKKSVSLIEFLPLFEEEINLLYDYLGKGYEGVKKKI